MPRQQRALSVLGLIIFRRLERRVPSSISSITTGSSTTIAWATWDLSIAVKWSVRALVISVHAIISKAVRSVDNLWAGVERVATAVTAALVAWSVVISVVADTGALGRLCATAWA